MIRPKLLAALALTTLAALTLPCRAQISMEADVAAEAPLGLVGYERFDSVSREGWSLPPGWTRFATADGFTLRIAAAQAGLKSVARAPGTFGHVVIEGQFTFVGAGGTGQLVVRESSAGAYVAQLDAAGLVTLEKRAGDGAVVSSWSAVAEKQAVPGAARALQLSAIGGSLRVTVDGIDILTAVDAAPLPPGANKIGAVFTSTTGGLLFDNYFVWVPSAEITPEVQASSASLLAAAPLASNAVAPSNDELANRHYDFGSRYADIRNNAGATLEAGEPIPSAAANLDRTVWYEFTPDTSKPYLLTTVGSSFNTVLAVYTSSTAIPTFATLTEVAFNDDVTGSLQARLTLNLTQGQTYYIQLGGRVSSGNFEFRIADPVDAQVPSTPVISSSASNAPSTPVADKGSTADFQPVLAWEPRPSVTPYDYVFELSTEATFSPRISVVIQEPARFFQTAYLQADQKYYWRVAARNFLGQASAFSPAYTFSTDTQAPTRPLLIAPALNEAVETLRPTFTWQPVADAAKYHFRIATNFSLSTPQSAANDVDVATTSFTPATDLPQGEYWYGAGAFDAAGNWSDYGEKRHFTVNVSKTPANGANIVSQGSANTADVVLTWTAIPGGTYDLQVATDSSFSGTVFEYPNLTTNSFTLTNWQYGNYYWRVRVNGQELPISLARSFNVTPPLPEAPLIQTTGAIPGAVTDGLQTTDQSPNFDWTVPANWVTPPVGQSITYQWIFATNSEFTQGVFDATGLPDSYLEWPFPDLPPTPGTTYYWRVRARTNLGLVGAYSKTYSFTVDLEAPAPPTLVSPVENADFSILRPTLTWQAVDGATAYHVRISDDANATHTVGDNDAELTATSFTPTTSLQHGKYWFAVESRDAAGNWSGFGEKRPFAINLSLTPADGAAVVAKAPANTAEVAFTWADIPGANAANTRRLEVSKVSNFATTVYAGPPTNGNTGMTTLAIGTYYWRVTVTGWQVSAAPAHKFVVSPELPVGPLLQTAGAISGAVMDRAITNDRTPVFDWTVPANWMSPPPGGSIDHYELQLAKDSAFTSLVGAPVTNLTNTDYEWPGELMSGVTYYWRVRAVTNLGAAGAFSKTYRFTLDARAPVLEAPALNSFNSSLRPTFRWKAVSKATAYHVRIATNFSVSPGGTVGANDVVIPGTSFKPAADLPQGEYWFAVESRDAAGNWSGFGEKRRFVVSVALSPANGVNVIAKAPAYAPDVTLKWVSVPNTVYDLQVSPDSSFTVFTVATTVSVPSYKLTNLPIGTYYWRVALNGAFLPQSLSRSFTVTSELPKAPVIQTAGAQPEAVTNNRLISDNTPVFDWTVPANWATPPLGSSLTYELQLATNSSFSQLVDAPVTGIGISNYEWPTPLTPGATYYWRVRARTNLGLFGAFSKTYAFTLDTTDPTLPTPTAPADFAVSSSARPGFSWTKGANGASLYRFEICSEPSFTTTLAYTATISKTSLTLPVSLGQGVYYWHVFAQDAAGNETDVATDTRTLTIDYRSAPVDDAEIAATTAAGIPVRFTWKAPTGAPKGTTYTIEIDSDLDGTADIMLPAVTTVTTLSSALLPGYYQYRLVVSNGFGTSDWRNFTILPP